MSRGRKSRRRTPEEFSVSFLDVICCGFGAVILLLMITKTAESQILDSLVMNLRNDLIELKQAFLKLETSNQRTELKVDSLSEVRLELKQTKNILLEKLKSTSRLISKTSDIQAVENHKKLRQRLEELNTLEEDLLKNIADNRNELVIGIHADRPYIIFVVDLSGSMNPRKEDGSLSRVIASILDAHPQTRGMQVFDSDGNQVIFETIGWIEDSQVNRSKIKQRLESFPSDASNPTKGLIKAVDLIDKTNFPGSIFLIGDDFRAGISTCQNPTSLVRGITKRNRKGVDGIKITKINAIGMRTYGGPEGRLMSECFARLARPLTGLNDGAFVGL